MVLGKDARRLGIFFFYDKDGVVDEYVMYYLEKICPFFKEILIVCNGKLMPEGRNKLEGLDNTTVLVRKNKGFDVWAYKTGIEYIGWERLQSDVDELIMFNFTIMGPVDGFDDMFEEMDQRDIDFWGVTIHNGAPFDPWGVMEDGKIPVHIQSHFIAVRKKMLSSFEFQQYWENMPMIKRYEEAVGMHEAIFTRTFEESGYTWSVYVDTDDLLEETFYPMFNMPVELIKHRKCPFFKRKLFIQDWNSCIDENGYHAGAELYSYLRNDTSYDTDMIVKHIMRTGNLYDFVNAINSRLIVPTGVGGGWKRDWHEESQKVAIIISVGLDTHYYFRPYLWNIPSNATCYIFAPNEYVFTELTQGYNNKNFFYVKQDVKFPESQWMRLLGQIYADYDYVCKIGDIGSAYFETLTNVRSYAKVSYDCMMYSEEYVAKVLELFEKNARLGMLLPMQSMHSEYFGLLGNEWGDEQNYKVVCDALETLNCKIPLSYDVRPIVSLSGCMWFRMAALKMLLTSSDIANIEEIFIKKRQTDSGEKKAPHLLREMCTGMKYIWAYAAQQSGFYTSYVCPEAVAANTMVNYDNILGKINYDMHNECSLHKFLFEAAADFVKINVNCDTGSGYIHKNLQTEVIIRRQYSTYDVAVRFEILPKTKEIVINIAEGLMCICKNTQFGFWDEDDYPVHTKYSVLNTADLHVGKDIDCFYGKNAEYRLKGDFINVSFMVLSFEQLVVMPVVAELKDGIKGRKSIFGR